jgi:hypothetical protein
VRRLITLAVILGIGGLAVGYLIFGRYALGNELIPVGRLFSIGDSSLVDGIRDAAGFADKRQSIFISGGVGLAAGVVFGLLLNRRR